MVEEVPEQDKTHAWDPGIDSTLPAEYLQLSTLFRPENVFTSLETATELSDFTGLSLYQVVRIRPERLVVHELLIRVSADIFISDGSKYEDLGINFRDAVATIHQRYIAPKIPEIVAWFEDFEQRVRTMVDDELSVSLFVNMKTTDRKEKRFSFAGLFRSAKKPNKAAANESLEERNRRLLGEWREKSEASNDPFQRSVYAELGKVANAILMKHGRIIGDQALLTSLVTGFVCNNYGSEIIGEKIAPWIKQAADSEGYRLLPAQKEPVLINVKGSSAAGKSTMRPLQHQHTEKLGLDWQDFALISPDIWRKYLLDYESLGPATRYAGTLVGDEVAMLDQKFDRYIKYKSQHGGLSHLLIDRFRFNTFAHGLDAEKGSNLLTRFGHTVYLLFLVTPPEATVERAWKRGLQVGRFKSVDDLLDHNIEAFKGIPDLFFTWSLHKEKKVFYEFLDNSVAYGDKPRTIAFGINSEMFILDIKCMLDIVRYTKINIEANNPKEVYPAEDELSAEANTDFLVQCTKKLARVSFVDCQSGLVYAVIESGVVKWVDKQLIRKMLKDEEVKLGFQAIVGGVVNDLDNCSDGEAHTVPLEMRQHVMGDIKQCIA